MAGQRPALVCREGHFRLAGGGDEGLQKLFSQEVQGALKYKGTAHYAWV